MSESGGTAGPTPGGFFGSARVLQRIPLPVRMVAYGVLFLALVLGGLPWLAYRIDLFWPAVHVEIDGVRMVGLVVLAVCFAVYLGCSIILSRRGRGAYVEFDPPQAFVTNGPYRWCRNPIAACVIGMVFGEALAFSSTGILLLAALGVPLAHAQVVWLEEPLLRRRFGATYEEYLRQVPRWLPRRPTKGQP
jgi:protein-S-isoprenylcysteine O-methyltransferase Ste14